MSAIGPKRLASTHPRRLRAEPVALMYQQGKIRHVDPPMKALEDEMCDFGMGGLSSGASPDRLDALVWAVTELVTRGVRGPRIRML
jgi:phage terminase large subunit-like protein